MTASEVVSRVCVTHPERAAERVCTKCLLWHCDECAKPLTERANGPMSCPACRGILRYGDLGRRVDTTEQLLWRVFSREGALMIFLLALPALPMGLGGLIGFASFVLWVGVLGGYFLQTIDHLAAGEPGLPFSSDVMFAWDIVGRFLRALWLAAVALGPAALTAIFVPDGLLLALAFLAFGVALAPASLLASVVTRSTLNLIWPLSWIEIVQRSPVAYLRLLGELCGSVVVWVGLTLFLGWLLAPVPLVLLLLTPFLHTAFALWVAALFGRHLQREADSYGVFY